MPKINDFLPAEPPYPPLPRGLIDYLIKRVVPEPRVFYGVGDKVEHPVLGWGTIIEYRYSAGRWLVNIKFDDPEYGTKTFLAEVPYLTKEDVSKLTLKE